MYTIGRLMSLSVFLLFLCWKVVQIDLVLFTYRNVHEKRFVILPCVVPPKCSVFRKRNDWLPLVGICWAPTRTRSVEPIIFSKNRIKINMCSIGRCVSTRVVSSVDDKRKRRQCFASLGTGWANHRGHKNITVFRSKSPRVFRLYVVVVILRAQQQRL